MKLYHGSKQIITNPIVKGSKEDNDYGPAFYMTTDLRSAHQWACRNSVVGVVNCYSMNLEGLNILDLTDKAKYSVLNWLAILLHFRHLDNSFRNSFSERIKFIEEQYYVPVDQYDVVIGYRADDAYFRFPLDFVVGNITLEQLEESFMLGELGTQVVIVSEKAIKRLVFKKSIDSPESFIDDYHENVMAATERYNKLNKNQKGTRIFNLMGM